MVYAARVKADPARSPMYELDAIRREEDLAQAAGGDRVHTSPRQSVSAILLGGGCRDDRRRRGLQSWYIIELGGLFFAMGLIAGLVSGMSANELAKTFVNGCKDIAGAALIVGFAGGILVILEAGNIMDTILRAMSSVTSHLPGVVRLRPCTLMQLVLNFFIPSGSTKAALTMPLMAPLADLSGITRQTAVLAYQFGDGFTNMIIPTSGVTVGTLAMAKIPFEKWFRWNLPMQGMFILMSLPFLVWPVLSHWQ